MGNIAVDIATQEAIANANQEISGMVNPTEPTTIETAPEVYQYVYEEIFYSTYTDVSKAILAYSPASSLAQQQYIASKSIYGFCVSFSYTNAGNSYDNTCDGYTANCNNFGGLYLPTYETFQDTVSSFVEGTNTSIIYPPSSVDNLNNNIIEFSKNIENNPVTVGQTRQDITGPHSIAIEFPLGINATAYCEGGNTTSVPPFTPPQVYVNLTNGIVRFSLTASSDLWQQSLTPFVLDDANPQVINLQTYLKGVTSPDGQFIKMSANPISPYIVYQDDSGVGTPYTLPPYIGSSGSSSFFAKFDSIQVQETCPGTDETLVSTKWMGGEQLLFCTDYSSDLQAPFEGIAAYNFLFPSLFTTWELQMNSHICDTHFYTIVNETLVLQVVFQYIASTTPSPADPNTCYQKCYNYNGVLPGQLWCDQPNCGDCPAYRSYNGTDLTNGTDFCLCNVWNGENEMCTPTLGLSDTFSLLFLSDGSSRRNLRKKNEKGSGVEGTKSNEDMNNNEKGAKADKSEAKAGKSGMASQSALEEVLQLNLKKCDDHPELPPMLAELVMTPCQKVGKRSRRVNEYRCEFHLEFIFFDSEGSEGKADAKKKSNYCIESTLKETIVLDEISATTGSNDFVILDENDEIVSQYSPIFE